MPDPDRAYPRSHRGNLYASGNAGALTLSPGPTEGDDGDAGLDLRVENDDQREEDLEFQGPGRDVRIPAHEGQKVDPPMPVGALSPNGGPRRSGVARLTFHPPSKHRHIPRKVPRSSPGWTPEGPRPGPQALRRVVMHLAPRRRRRGPTPPPHHRPSLGLGPTPAPSARTGVAASSASHPIPISRLQPIARPAVIARTRPDAPGTGVRGDDSAAGRA